MSRTRTIFVVIIGVALIAILAGAAAFLLISPRQTTSPAATPDSTDRALDDDIIVHFVWCF